MYYKNKEQRIFFRISVSVRGFESHPPHHAFSETTGDVSLFCVCVYVVDSFSFLWITVLY